MFTELLIHSVDTFVNMDKQPGLCSLILTQFFLVTDIESRLVLAAGLFAFGLVAKICLDLSKHSVDTFVNADTNQFLAEIAKAATFHRNCLISYIINLYISKKLHAK